MTVNQLHKMTEALIKEGHKRKRVCIDKYTFRHPQEDDGATILDVKSGALLAFPMIGEDGCTKLRENGEESCHWAFVLEGGAE